MRFAAPALQQSVTSLRSPPTVDAARLGEGGPGHGQRIVLVQPHPPGGASVTSQRHPLVPASSLFLPPHIMMS